MGGDPFSLDLSWLPTTGWASKGRVPHSSLKPVEKGGWQFRWGFDDPEEMKRAGTILALGGGLLSAIGAYSKASSGRYQSDSAALAFEFEERLSGRAARASEHEAQSIMAAGKMEIGRLTLAHGQQAAGRRAVTAGRGIRADRGSSARVAASEAARSQIDVATIRENTVRAAGGAREQAARLYGESLLNRVSARNARRTARLFNPFFAAATSIMQSLGAFGAQVASDQVNQLRTL